MDAIHRADSHGLISFFFGTAVRIDHLGLFKAFIKDKDLGADLHTAFTAQAVFGFNNRDKGHIKYENNGSRSKV